MLAKSVRLEKQTKAAKAASTETPDTATSNITTYAGGVTIEDVDEDADGTEKPEELTENTPEARVKVHISSHL